MDQLQAPEHWNQMYSTQQKRELSWFEEAPAVSQELLLTPRLDISMRRYWTLAAVPLGWSMPC